MTVVVGLDTSGSYNGWQFGRGTRFPVVNIEGLDDLGDLSSVDLQRPGRHGVHSGADYAGARVVTLTLGVWGDDAQHFDALVAEMANATPPSSVDGEVGTLTLYAGAVELKAKPRRRSVPRDHTRVQRTAEATLEFYAPDPRVFLGGETVLVTGLPQAGVGHGFNHGFNLSFGGTVGSGGIVSFTNVGNATTFPRFVLDTTGSTFVDNATVENLTTGEKLTVESSWWASVMEIDSDTRTVTYGGEPFTDRVRYGSRFPSIVPGENLLRFSADGYAAGATMTVYARSARI